MGVNYLEQLVSEWYEYRGYFVRRNVLVGKLSKGGYECELDVVAFHPQDRKLVHVEPSMDASSWAQRQARYRKKFNAGRKYIPELFAGMSLPQSIDQITLLQFASKKNHTRLGGGRIVLVPELLKEIAEHLTGLTIASQAVSEQFPIMRTMQFVTQYRSDIFGESVAQ